MAERPCLPLARWAWAWLIVCARRLAAPNTESGRAAEKAWLRARGRECDGRGEPNSRRAWLAGARRMPHSISVGTDVRYVMARVPLSGSRMEARKEGCG